MTTTIRNALVLSPEYEFRRADITIRDGHIAAIEPSAKFDPGYSPGHLDFTNRIVLPGLANGHFHSQSTLLRGLTENRTLANWTDSSDAGKTTAGVFNFLDHDATPDELIAFSAHDYLSLLAQGITFTQDSGLAECDPSIYATAMKLVGISGVIDCYHRTPPPPVHPSIHYGMHILEEEDITEASMEKCKFLRTNSDAVRMSHCLETKERLACVESVYGCSTVALFSRYALLDSRTVLFHLTHATMDDIAILAEHGVSAICCLTSNRIVSGTIPPLSLIAHNKVRLGLGTDWATTDLWREMYAALALLWEDEDIRETAATEVLKMVTLNPRRAFGVSNAGVVAPEMCADLCVIDLESPALGPLLGNLPGIANFAFDIVSAGSNAISDVMVSGQWVIRNGSYTDTLRIAKLSDAYDRALVRLISTLHP